MKKEEQIQETIRGSIAKSARMFWKVLPLILGTILLVSLMITLIPKSFYLMVFQNNIFLDPFIGSAIGSASAGNPLVSYIIGGELLDKGISLIAVTAFIVAWVTVGIIQLPAESMILGKKFAFARNILSFILAIVVALITVAILGFV